MKVKKDKKLKKYNIDEVLKQDKWIIMDIEDELRVYDLTKWIDEHPGGDKIYNGIKANMYYKDKSKSSKSPMEIFMGNQVNKDKNVLKRFLLQKNKYVKLIGYLNNIKFFIYNIFIMSKTDYLDVKVLVKEMILGKIQINKPIIITSSDRTKTEELSFLSHVLKYNKVTKKTIFIFLNEVLNVFNNQLTKLMKNKRVQEYINNIKSQWDDFS